MELFKKIKEYLNSKDKSKTVTNMVILILIGVLLVIASNLFKSPSTQTFKMNSSEDGKTLTTNKSSGSVTKEYEIAKTNELKSVLESISGVGRVNIMLNFDSGEEEVPAANVNKSNSVTVEKAADGSIRTINQETNGTNIVVSTQNGESSPTIVKKYNPKVTGVIIVAEGAEDKTTERQIKFAVIKLFNILEEKVTVLPMKK